MSPPRGDGVLSNRRELRVPLPADGFSLAAALIVIAQAGWLAIFLSRGWFYGDDMPYEAEATGKSLSWHFLSRPLNDHFDPGLRLEFWLMNRGLGLEHWPTIVFRVLLQAAATLLLARLLVRLCGKRPGLLLVLGWYAFGQLLIPGSLWLSTALGLMPAQVLLILTLDFHVRYHRSGRWRDAAGAAGCLLAATCFWELSLVYVLLLPIISIAILQPGSLRSRLMASIRRWPGWAMIALAVGAWLFAFVSGPYGGSANAPGIGAYGHEIRTGWVAAVAPAAIGGPWRWFSTANVYYSIANPRLTTEILAEVIVVVVLVTAFRRSGWRALAAWSMPALVFVISTVIIAVGRYRTFGDLTPRSLNYSFPLAVPLALALALSLSPSAALRPATRPSRSGGLADRWRPTPRTRTRLLAVAVIALLASNLFSAARFSARWHQNPSERYLANLSSSVRRAGPTGNLWDTRVPDSVLAAFSDHNHISDVLALAGVSARFQQPESDPQLVGPDGTLEPAALYSISHGVQRKATLCTALVQRAGTWQIPLSIPLGANEYFIKISYLQGAATTLYISGTDQAGHTVVPVGGTQRRLISTLANLYLRMPLAGLTSLTIRSETADANVCIGAVNVGVPVKAGP